MRLYFTINLFRYSTLRLFSTSRITRMPSNVAPHPIPHFKLNTGANIPSVGLGTFDLVDKDEVRESVLLAIKVGYRHFDCADWYRSEVQLGEAIREAISQGLVKREDLFITTKVWNDQQRFADLSLEKSLRKLGLDYVDLFLIHWPIAFKQNFDDNNNLISHPTEEDFKKYDIYDYDWNFVKTWKLLEKVYNSGKAKAIGVSNFSQGKLDIILKNAKVKPAVNQIQINPYNPSFDLVEYSQKNGLVVEGYSPFGSLDLNILEDENIQKWAKKKQVSPGALVLSWMVSRGIVALAKSSKTDRVESNFNIIKLSQEDVDFMNSIADKKQGGSKRTGSSVWVPKGLFDDSDLKNWNFDDVDIDSWVK